MLRTCPVTHRRDAVVTAVESTDLMRHALLRLHGRGLKEVAHGSTPYVLTRFFRRLMRAPTARFSVSWLRRLERKSQVTSAHAPPALRTHREAWYQRYFRKHQGQVAVDVHCRRSLEQIVCVMREQGWRVSAEPPGSDAYRDLRGKAGTLVSL